MLVALVIVAALLAFFAMAWLFEVYIHHIQDVAKGKHRHD